MTSYCYGLNGLVEDETDANGIVTRTLYDALGRTDQTIQNFVGGAETDTENVATVYAYNGDNETTMVKVLEPDSAYQQTEYVYGVTTASGT